MWYFRGSILRFDFKTSSLAVVHGHHFLGALAKLGKVTINFVTSVCPSVRIEHLKGGPPLDGFALNLIYEKFFGRLSKMFKIR
jgi:hypothetical protein